MIKNRLLAIGALVGLLIYGAALWCVFGILHPVTEGSVVGAPALPAGAVEQVTVRDHRLYRVTPTGTTTKFVPPEGSVAVTVYPAGQVRVEVHDKGLTIRPGLGVVFGQGKPLPCLSTKLAYWGRLGLAVGTPIKRGRWTPHAAVTFRPFERYATEVFVGIDAAKDAVLGIRVSF